MTPKKLADPTIDFERTFFGSGFIVEKRLIAHIPHLTEAVFGNIE
jgi:hypothetical protein